MGALAIVRGEGGVPGVASFATGFRADPRVLRQEKIRQQVEFFLEEACLAEERGDPRVAMGWLEEAMREEVKLKTASTVN
jgi:hypothetical protein